MRGLLQALFAPIYLAWAACMGIWNFMTDRGWNYYLRLLMAGLMFLGVAALFWWVMNGFQW